MSGMLLAGAVCSLLVAATAQEPSDSVVSPASTRSTARARRPRIGDLAPAFDLGTLDGHRLGRDTLAGKVTVVEFFATWCLPCSRSLDDLRGLQSDLADLAGPGKGLNILIIAADDAVTLRAHLAQHPAPDGALIAIDPQRSTGRRWGQDRFPTSFFVDREGIIRHINRGHGPGFRARAAGWLRGMLQPAPESK